jgi:hypothetical protein
MNDTDIELAILTILKRSETEQRKTTCRYGVNTKTLEKEVLTEIRKHYHRVLRRLRQEGKVRAVTVDDRNAGYEWRHYTTDYILGSHAKNNVSSDTES